LLPGTAEDGVDGAEEWAAPTFCGTAETGVLTSLAVSLCGTASIFSIF